MRPHYLLTTVIAAVIGASAAYAQNAPTAAAPEANADGKKSLQIVFVPKELIEKNKKSGKLKEDTFYWTNVTNNPDHSPKGVTEEGKPFLRMQGHVAATEESPDLEKKNARSASKTFMLRAFNVPAGATNATVTTVTRATHDVWEDSIGGTVNAGSYLTKDGKSLAGSAPKLNLNKGWETQTASMTLHPGTQQIVVEFVTEGKIPLDISSLEVAFK